MFLVAAAAACSRDARPAQAPATTTETPAPSTAGGPDGAEPAQGVEDPGAAGGTRVTELVDPGATTQQPVREAVAILMPTQGSQVSGLVRFRETDLGVEVFTTVQGLPGGNPHAYHVHVYGDCSSPDAKSAGPHFHFTGSSLDTEVDMITGNLGELEAAGQRTTTHQAQIEAATLQGQFSIIGRAVVVHAMGNDPKVTPDGGAGARIACGVIGVANPQPPRTATAPVK
jgi:Cu-Zn family superoxide dismutase